MAWDGVERRKAKRYGIKNCTLQYKSAYCLGLFSTLSEKYLVLDISPNGLHFITKTKPKEKASLLLTITAPLLNDRNIHLTGRVVWIKKSPELDVYRTGVVITGISDTHRNRLKLILDNAVLDKIDLSTRIYLKEVEKL
jgi:hypothetical protein